MATEPMAVNERMAMMSTELVILDSHNGYDDVETCLCRAEIKGYKLALADIDGLRKAAHDAVVYLQGSGTVGLVIQKALAAELAKFPKEEG